MPSINDALLDSSVRHQIFLIRYGGTAVNDLIALLDEAEVDIRKRLEARIARLGPLDRQQLGRGLATTRRLKTMLAEIRVLNRDLHTGLNKRLRKNLRELIGVEVDLASRRLDEAFGVDLNNLRPAPELLRAAVDGSVVRGRTLRQWFRKLEGDTFASLDAAVRLGVVEGNTTQQISRRVRDALGVTKRKADLLARTSVNAVANQARDLLYSANSDVVKGWQFTAQIDGKTSAICQALDGQEFDIGKGPRPPRHPNCRSVSVPITKSWKQLAKRGALNPKRRVGGNIDLLFTRRLRARGFDDDAIATIKRDTRASMDGQVPAKLSYEEWLRRQDASFQDDVLGIAKAKLFREGKVSLSKFVDIKTGRPISLDKLKLTGMGK